MLITVSKYTLIGFVVFSLSSVTWAEQVELLVLKSDADKFKKGDVVTVDSEQPGKEIPAKINLSVASCDGQQFKLSRKTTQLPKISAWKCGLNKLSKAVRLTKYGKATKGDSGQKTLWMLDATQAGLFCIPENRTHMLILWRPEPLTSTFIEIKNSNQHKLKLDWSKDKIITKWRTKDLAITESNYELKIENLDANQLNLRFIPSSYNQDKLKQMLWMVKHDCIEQAAYLLHFTAW